jgi:predicted amidophosphoribosyltransferase
MGNNEDAVCGQCKKLSRNVDRLSSYGIYEGVLKEAIHLFKYSRNIYTGEHLAGFALEAFKKKFSPKELDLIIPVPLHQSRLRWREFNQAVIISEKIGKSFDIPIVCDLLIRKKRTKSQTNLTVEERMINIKDAFKVKQKTKTSYALSWISTKLGFKKDNKIQIRLKGKRVLLVDDVLTTGITTDECAKVLKDNNVDYVGVVTVAKTVF